MENLKQCDWGACTSGIRGLSGHLWHCSECDTHLISLFLCPECGVRYVGPGADALVGAVLRDVRSLLQSIRTSRQCGAGTLIHVYAPQLPVVRIARLAVLIDACLAPIAALREAVEDGILLINAPGHSLDVTALDLLGQVEGGYDVDYVACDECAGGECDGIDCECICHTTEGEAKVAGRAALALLRRQLEDDCQHDARLPVVAAPLERGVPSYTTCPQFVKDHQAGRTALARLRRQVPYSQDIEAKED